MLKRSLQVSLIAAAFAAGAARASDYVKAGGAPVRTASGECVRTGYWATPSADCEPELAAKAAAAVEPVKVPIEEANLIEAGEKVEMPPAKEMTFSAEVLFAFDSYTLDSQGRKQLDLMVDRLGPSGVENVLVTAYADRIGESHYNLLLSERRVEAIRAYLAQKGVTQVGTQAKGEEEPATKGACDGMGPENRKNEALVECLRPDRRAEVTVMGRPRLIRSGDASNRIEAAASDRGGRAALEGR